MSFKLRRLWHTARATSGCPAMLFPSDTQLWLPQAALTFPPSASVTWWSQRVGPDGPCETLPIWDILWLKLQNGWGKLALFYCFFFFFNLLSYLLILSASSWVLSPKFPWHLLQMGAFPGHAVYLFMLWPTGKIVYLQGNIYLPGFVWHPSTA